MSLPNVAKQEMLAKCWRCEKKPYICNMKTLIIILAALFSSSLPVAARGLMDKLLTDLDRTIDSIPYYEQKKQKHIRLLREALRKNDKYSLLEEYEINMKLYEAYETYICDSAMYLCELQC